MTEVNTGIRITIHFYFRQWIFKKRGKWLLCLNSLTSISVNGKRTQKQFSIFCGKKYINKYNKIIYTHTQKNKTMTIKKDEKCLVLKRKPFTIEILWKEPHTLTIFLTKITTANFDGKAHLR